MSFSKSQAANRDHFPFLSSTWKDKNQPLFFIPKGCIPPPHDLYYRPDIDDRRTGRKDFLMKDISIQKKDLVSFFFLSLILFILFLPSLNFPFLQDWDDGSFVMFNPNLSFSLKNILFYALEPFKDLYTPLPMYSLMIDHALFGLHPLGFRLHNLLLHAVACGFLYLIIRRLGMKAWIAFAAAILWAVNPQKVESVAWVTERKDVLCGALAFASIYCFLRSVSARRIPVLAGILAMLAIFAKPAAIPLPGVMIVGLICLYGKQIPWREYLRFLTVPVLLSVIAVAWSAWVTGKTNPGSRETNLLVPLHNLFWYPLTALIPYSQNPIYPTLRSFRDVEFPVLAGILLTLFYIRAGRYFRISWRKILCTLAIVGGCTVPVLGLLHYTRFHYCDRYNYLVSAAVWAGAAILLSACVRRLRSGERPLQLVCCVIGVVFFYQTWSYIPFWKNCNTLYPYVLAQDQLVNIKALGNSISFGFRVSNVALIEDVAGRLKKYHREYGISEATADNMVLFLKGHIALLQNDIPQARTYYFRLYAKTNSAQSGNDAPDMKRIFALNYKPSDALPAEDGEAGRSARVLWPAMTLPLLYRDLALISAIENRPSQAVFFLNREMKERKQTDLQYFIAAAMKARMTGDSAGQIEAWEIVVKMAPGNQGYRKFLQKLKRDAYRSGK